MPKNNPIALVTGSNRGIGLAVVKQLLDQGITTILTSRNPKSGRRAAEDLENPDHLHVQPLDVDDPDSIHNLRDWVADQFGRLDILVNNAAINYDTWQSTVEADLNVVRETFETNLLGPWRMCQAFLPMMQQHGYGRIVNVSSGSGSLAEMGGGTPAYGISKASLNVLTIKLSHELKGTGILVNSVCPGWVRTDMGGQGAPRSPEKGAETIFWLAFLPENGPSGKFWRNKQEISF
jgi:NAD(P)-dependent dehydrogenase (short-subunit alcohol dehydrogenase family)